MFSAHVSLRYTFPQNARCQHSFNMCVTPFMRPCVYQCVALSVSLTRGSFTSNINNDDDNNNNIIIIIEFLFSASP